MLAGCVHINYIPPEDILRGYESLLEILGCGGKRWLILCLMAGMWLKVERYEADTILWCADPWSFGAWGGGTGAGGLVCCSNHACGIPECGNCGFGSYRSGSIGLFCNTGLLSYMVMCVALPGLAAFACGVINHNQTNPKC